MKKIMFMFLLSGLFICNVEAFQIDMNKITIDSKSNELVNTIDKQYNIDIKGFDNDIDSNDDVIELVKKLINISFAKDKEISDKRKEFAKYIHLSSDKGVDSLNADMFIKLYLEELEKKNIVFNKVKNIKTVNIDDNQVLAFAFIDDAYVDKDKQDIVLVYWFKKNDDTYGVYYPWLTIGNDLEEHFRSVTKSENKGDVIGGTFNKISLNENGDVLVSDSKLKEIYNANKNTSVQITGMNDTGDSVYGSGFFIREGVVVTTWSLFLKAITDSDYLYVNDCNGNTYDVLGVIAAQIDYDVVVLKINKEVGLKAILGDNTDFSKGDKVFTINSKNNGSFSINYGSNINITNGRLENMFAVSSSDVGGALYNDIGHVIGFIVDDQINSELSYANSTNYLRNLQNILVNKKYSKIGYTVLETFKQKYYLDIQDERVYNNVDKDIWNKYKNIGELEKNIVLPLVKADYIDNILSLRYKNETGTMIDSLYLVSNFTNKLTEEGYKQTYLDSGKSIYMNDKYKIVVKNNFDYLIILIMEI